MKTPAEKDETTLEFYTRIAAEDLVYANTLLAMYKARKIKETPVADALWAGQWAVRQQAEEHAKKRDSEAARVAMMTGAKA